MKKSLFSPPPPSRSVVCFFLHERIPFSHRILTHPLPNSHDCRTSAAGPYIFFFSPPARPSSVHVSSTLLSIFYFYRVLQLRKTPRKNPPCRIGIKVFVLHSATIWMKKLSVPPFWPYLCLRPLSIIMFNRHTYFGRSSSLTTAFTASPFH